MFGEERMRDVLVASRGMSGADVSDRLLRELETYSGKKDFEDDVCVVAVESR
jgi:serine phosphatase RsbU (regulator of sigma subunit)